MRTELVTTLKRQTTKLLAELERSKEPILITQHGIPSAYLVDVESYETLLRRMSCWRGSRVARRRSRMVVHSPMHRRRIAWAMAEVILAGSFIHRATD